MTAPSALARRRLGQAGRAAHSPDDRRRFDGRPGGAVADGRRPPRFRGGRASPAMPSEALDALKSGHASTSSCSTSRCPGASGLEALPDIIAAGRGARVLIVSSMAEDGAEVTVRALAEGAADTLPKPGIGNFAGRFSEVLADRLRRIGRAERGQTRRGPARDDAADPAARHARPAARLHRAGRLDRRARTPWSNSCAPCPAGSARRSWSPSICRPSSCPISPASSKPLPAAPPASPRTASRFADELIHVAPGRRPSLRRAGKRRRVRVRLDRKRAAVGLPALGRSDARLGRRRLWRRRRRRDAERHGPRRPGRQPAGWSSAAARCWPRTRRARRSGACRAPSPRRGSPRRCCRRPSWRAGSPSGRRRSAWK